SYQSNSGASFEFDESAFPPLAIVSSDAYNVGASFPLHPAALPTASTRSSFMWRNCLAAAAVIVFAVSGALAADKEVMGKLVRVDDAKNHIIVKTDDGTKTFEVNDETKFIGPKGGVSDKGIKDDRLVAGVELKLVVAANNKTLHEVHIPEKKSK